MRAAWSLALATALGALACQPVDDAGMLAHDGDAGAGGAAVQLGSSLRSEAGWLERWGADKADLATSVARHGDRLVVGGLAFGAETYDPEELPFPTTPAPATQRAYVAHFTLEGEPVGGQRRDAPATASRPSVAAGGGAIYLAALRERVELERAPGEPRRFEHRAYVERLDAGEDDGAGWTHEWLTSYRSASPMSPLLAAMPDGSALVAGDEGGVFVAGTSQPTLPFIARFAPDGGLLWRRDLGDEDAEVLMAIAASEDGAIFVYGVLRSGAATLMRLDGDGGTRWVRRWGAQDASFVRKASASGHVATGALAPRSDGGVVVVGSFVALLAELDFDPDPELELRLPAAGSMDGFASAFDSDGEHLWAYTLAGQGADAATSVVEQPDGSIAVSAWFEDSARLSDGTPLAAEQFEAVLLELDAEGHLERTRMLGGAGEDAVHDLLALDDGSLVMVGSFEQRADLLLGELDSRGQDDAFVARLHE